MRSFLPYVFLVDVADAPTAFRYRLVGSEISRWASREYTGVAVNCREYGPNWRHVFDAYARVVQTGAPEIARYHAPWVGREFLVYERLIAPLSNSGTKIDMLFGALCPVGEAMPDQSDRRSEKS
jgi:hypothetical protein